MATDFWTAQDRARSRTKFYLTLFIAMTLGAAICVEVVARTLAPQNFGGPFPIAGGIFAGTVFLISLVQYGKFKTYGGGYVAESMGGQRVDANSSDFQEQQLYNIVQEMAIASGMPMPAVYIIDAKQINAFAAGLEQSNAAIAVTRGCLELLNRDELQGVVAHEFGHIYNKDMRISLRLSAMLMGFFFLLTIALRVLQGAALSGRRSNSRGGNPVALLALIMLVAGAFTWLFGAILRAATSRQREFLADACAVQFTRNPSGIASALRKIGGMHVNDMPKQGMAYEHLYFDHRGFFSGLFATHPPLKKRLEAIEGNSYDPGRDLTGSQST